MTVTQAVDNSLDARRAFIADNLARWRVLFQELIRVPSLFEAEHDISAMVARHIESLGVQVQGVDHRSDTLRSLEAAQFPISEERGR